MKYSESEIVSLRNDAKKNAHVFYEESHIRPRFHKTKNKVFSSGKDDEDEDDDYVFKWSLRKCSATVLDVLEDVFNMDFLSMPLPITKELPFSPQ
ncbi:unnamed protein product [Heterobilharzia americana]|nr:unnamed protein product [Heterobilharzia americana]CAH8592709.1 unnamed protein product [Heterobilharzia americana]